MYGKSYTMSTEAYTDETVKVSTDFKTTLPKQARNRLGVDEGDEVSFKITESGRVVVEKASGR